MNEHGEPPTAQSGFCPGLPQRPGLCPGGGAAQRRGVGLCVSDAQLRFIFGRRTLREPKPMWRWDWECQSESRTGDASPIRLAGARTDGHVLK